MILRQILHTPKKRCNVSEGPIEVTRPAGTAVTVRLFSVVGSKLGANGDHFGAIVARPVVVNGKVVSARRS
jgi:hypothetical protein